MSIIRYTPVQDAFIVNGSVGQTINTGLDEILQLGHCSGIEAEGPARALLDFGLKEVPANVYKATLHLYLANASDLPLPEYTIRVYPVAESWQEGYGKYSDSRTENKGNVGVTWNYRNYSQDAWSIPGGDVTENQPYVSQSFSRLSSKDLDIDITQLFREKNCSNGFILAFGNEEEVMSLGSSLSFYSEDTHTIYRPYLQLEFNDSEHSSNLPVVTTEQISIVTEGFKPEYTVSDSARFNLRVCPKYPSRVYTTSSIYSNSYILPDESYWGIRNEYTNEMVIDFCEGTKISADNLGNYFNLDMGMLETGRYYRVLYQVNLDSNKRITFDNRNIFKVV